eukprot:scaffold664461_cov74-Prasinocladus_malaysianus.AAC.1
MPAGALVVLHGENVHYSAPNKSPVSRHAYSMHFVEGTDDHVWEPDNWWVGYLMISAPTM